MRFATTVGVLFLSLLHLPSPAAAQECDCDHRIELDVTGANGAELGVGPGDRVCIMAGSREFLRLRQFQGTATAPITLINCGGVVEIRNEDRAYALVFEEDSQFFHLTGTGSPDHTYGFRVSAPDTEPWPGVGLWLLGRSTNYEIDHVEIYETGFAGVSAKTDPLCDGSADQDVFVQRDTRFHHLYVHDTGGEGFYVGSTQSDGQTINCDGVDEVHQPHFLDVVEITDTIVERTGWDGMQVGMARTGCLVARNVIRHVGLEGVEYQTQGLQIGAFSACDVRNNIIEDGPANGIIILGADDTFVASNLIVDFEADGIYCNHRDRIPGANYRFLFNTIAGYGGHALRVFGPGAVGSGAMDNLVIGAEPAIEAGGDVDWTADYNLVFADAVAAGVIGGGDYHLLETSAARGAGVAFEEVHTDLDGRVRATPPSVGAYEYAEEIPADGDADGDGDGDVDADGDSDSDGDADGDGDGHGSADSDAGCSCAVAGGRPRRVASARRWARLW